MRIRKPNFSLKTLGAFVGICALLIWTYIHLLPQWRNYQQLRKIIKAEDMNSFISLDEINVNLDSKNQSRYLRVCIAIQVSRKHQLRAAQRVKDNHSELRDWLITHLSGKTLADVRGTDSINQIRTEIYDHFADILFPEGDSTLEKIVFEEFMVQ